MRKHTELVFIIVIALVVALFLGGAYVGNKAVLTVESYLNRYVPAVYETDVLD